MDAQKVLVVDDEPGFLMIMKTVLKRCSFEVVGAANGHEALEKMKQAGPFGVLVTDLMMPEINGIDLIRLARQLDPHVVPLIITAGATLDTAITALKDEGAFDYLVKPLKSMTELSNSVQRAMEYYNFRREREQLQAQAAVEISRLQSVVANSGDAILAADSQSNLMVANPAALKLFGQEQLIGKNAFEILPARLVSMLKNWQILGNRSSLSFETTLENGSAQMINLSPLQGSLGDSPGWVLVLRDISYIKQLDELKTEMLAEAAAKLRIPLADAMNSLIKLNVLTANSDERVTDIVYHLNSVWDNIKKWTDDLIMLVRVDSEKSAHQTSLDLNRVLLDLSRETIVSILNDKNLSMELQVAPQLPQVQADPIMLRRMLLGLLTRAALRSDKMGTLRLSAQLVENQVVITISDDGDSISETELAHIFEKSVFQVKTGALVSGSSLALVKTLAERMGGQVWVNSTAPKGSAVTVCLPLSSNAAE